VAETPSEPQELEKILNKTSIAVPDLERGYYVVTNVFSNAANAAKWSATLRSMKYNPQTMQRPDTNLFYVFVAYGEDGGALYETLKKVRSNELLKSAWVLKINMD
jgi:cell division septation protein DedD